MIHVAEISPSHLFAGQTCFKKPKPLLSDPKKMTRKPKHEVFQKSKPLLSDPKKMTLHCISVANLLLLQSPLESPLESPCLVNSVRDRHGPWGQKPKCAIQKIEYGLWMFMVIPASLELVYKCHIKSL